MSLPLPVPLPKKAAIHDFRRRWLVPVIALTGGALSLFFAAYCVDHLRQGGLMRGGLGPLERYLAFDAASITDAVSSLAGMIAAVFGIVITVVSIVLQLSANRYAGVTRMFLREPVNLTVMAYYVITCVSGIWTSVAIKSDFVPRTALLSMLVATTLGLALMVPYFGYVFWFLEPQNIIGRIRREALDAVRRGTSSGVSDHVASAQARAIAALEELTDVTSSSIGQKDKVIASAAVDAIKDLVLDYLKHKPVDECPWFRLNSDARVNPDFVAMDPESLTDLELRRTWFEWKAMRQYLGIFNEALGSMRDIDYLVAIDTHYLGAAAAANHDRELLRLVLHYMNSYLRSTLNARDVRTAYNILNQYRLLVEHLVRDEKLSDMAIEAVGYLAYYGRMSFGMELPFVTETIAYDLSTLCQVASESQARCEQQMLERFLQLDQPLRRGSDEPALLGIRKAQVKLATFYLARAQLGKAKLICDDMRHEPFERLATIRSALESVTNKDFWEIIDRGRNFEYMPEAQRRTLAQFFAWIGLTTYDEDIEPPLPSSVGLSESPSRREPFRS
ncbi:MAG TPA: DUF2254 family protein [Polyangiaceae bacterium]